MSCCKSSNPPSVSDSNAVQAVIEAYSARALKAGEDSDRMPRTSSRPVSVPSASYHADAKSIARAFGYTPEQLLLIPENANLGLSCGNPLALAFLREVDHSFLRSSTANADLQEGRTGA